MQDNSKSHTQRHTILRMVYQLCQTQFGPLLERATRFAESELFNCLNSVDDWLQHDYTMAINVLEANHEWLATQISESLLAKMREDVQSESQDQSASAAKFDINALSLVSKDEFEDWLNVNKAVKLIEREHSERLYALTKLYNLLANRTLNTADLPLGPKIILAEIKQFIDQLEIPPAPQVVFYKALANALIDDLRILYGDVLSLAEKHQIHATAQADKQSAPTTDNATKPLADGAMATSGSHEAESEVEGEVVREAENKASVQLEERAASSRESESWLSNASDSGAVQGPWNSADVVADLSNTQQGDMATLGTLSTLSRLNTSLASGRSLSGAQGVTSSRQAAAQKGAVAGGRLISLIRAMQQAPTSQATGGRTASLRQLIEQGISEHTDGGVAIGRQESELIDVTDRLFDVIIEKIGVSGLLEAWLEKLKLTILKIVLNDEHFFSNANHPARQMLNKLARLASSEQGGNKRL